MSRTKTFEPPAGGLSLYIHVPFCECKCNYCSFESAVPRAGDVELWARLLERELGWWSSRLGRMQINTCYIGGGTPTVVGAGLWRHIFALLESRFDFSKCAELTVEANPNSLTAEQLKAWRDWRVTRVSVGVQSFNEAELRLLGRLHSPRQAYEALSAVMAAGFDASADLMLALPHQPLRDWAYSLREAVRSCAGHISLYQLSLEPNTPWEKLDASLLPDGYAHYRLAQWYLPRKGFGQYEISSFAKKGKESRHNLNYWQEGQYIGVGPGASGYLNGWRYKNLGALALYAQRVEAGLSPAGSGERLAVGSRAGEAAMLALRTRDGIAAAEYGAEYGATALSLLLQTLRTLPEDLCTISERRIALTPKGMRVANRIWAEII